MVDKHDAAGVVSLIGKKQEQGVEFVALRRHHFENKITANIGYYVYFL